MARPAAAAAPSGHLRVLIDGAAPGARNMALDEALMRSARGGAVTLRLYRWDPPCLSFGRNQPARGRYDVESASARGIQVVRRPTGGRAVYHHREVTYAVTVPERLWDGPRRAYARINRALARGLARLGAPVELAPSLPGTSLPRPDPRACFGDPVPGEVTVGGRKLVGSAMWRRSGALLQHGSVLIHDDQRAAENLRLRRPDPIASGARATARRVAAPMDAGARGGSIGLAEACGWPLRVKEIRASLVRGFEEEFGLRAAPSAASAAELEEAARLEAGYAGPEWTWRR